MTKDVKYNYVEHGFWEKFTQAWESKSTWSTSANTSRDMPSSAMSSGVAPSDAHPARTSHSEGPCSAAAPAPKGKAKAKPKAKPSASWVQSAKLTKQAYASTMVQASTIQGQIDSDEKWAWARSHEITSAFSDARNTVSNAMASNHNFHDLMTADLNAAKKAANDGAVFEVEVNNFSETLDHHIKALQHECKSLLEQHAVRLKYAKGNS